MGVYIKGMEMPEKCEKCDLCFLIKGEHFCQFLYEPVNFEIEAGKRSEYCPLVPIPPHGRLIDADEMRDEWLINGENEYVYDTNAFLESIDNAPTIIPAEQIADTDFWGEEYAEAKGLAEEGELWPAADVRPVVLCRDCKHSEPWYADKSRCFLWHESGIDVFNDGFCNYGEKREES